MMKFIALFLFLSISSICYSQTSLKCVYIIQFPILDGVYKLEAYKRDAVIKMINEDKKVYSLTFSNGKYLYKKEPESVDRVGVETDVRSLYIDFKDSSSVTQYYYSNKFYIVKDKLHKYEWNISNETDTINGRLCTKAVLKSDSAIVAWFTPEVPFPYSPLGYYGLPGLTVRLKTRVYTLNLQSMTDYKGEALKPATEGEVTTLEKLNKKKRRNTEQLMKSADKVTEY